MTPEDRTFVEPRAACRDALGQSSKSSCSAWSVRSSADFLRCGGRALRLRRRLHNEVERSSNHALAPPTTPKLKTVCWPARVCELTPEVAELVAGCLAIRPTEEALRRSGVEGRDKDTKPVFIDLESYLFLEILHRWLTKAGELEVTEMLPTPDQLLWHEADGRRTFELRTLILPR